jgi:hypothetical protein
MNLLREKLAASAIHARVLPYILILVVTFLQDSFGEGARYWLYFAKMLLGAWCIWEMRSLVPEMRWAFSWEAIAVGVTIFAIWVFLDPYYPKFEFLFKMGNPWNPFKQYGEGSAMGWFFFWVRTLGSAILITAWAMQCSLTVSPTSCSACGSTGRTIGNSGEPSSVSLKDTSAINR